MKVYNLYHQYTKGDDSAKGIGWFSTLEKALAAKKEVEDQPGFVDYPNDFFIEVYEVDADEYGCEELIKVCDIEK